MPVSAYATVDEVIEAWADKAGAALGRASAAGGEARFFHLPGDPPHECFQIAIFPPEDNHITVQAASIDTNDGAEMLEVWKAPIDRLGALLENAVAVVQTWQGRLTR